MRPQAEGRGVSARTHEIMGYRLSPEVQAAITCAVQGTASAPGAQMDGHVQIQQPHEKLAETRQNGRKTVVLRRISTRRLGQWRTLRLLKTTVVVKRREAFPGRTAVLVVPGPGPEENA